MVNIARIGKIYERDFCKGRDNTIYYFDKSSFSIKKITLDENNSESDLLALYKDEALRGLTEVQLMKTDLKERALLIKFGDKFVLIDLISGGHMILEVTLDNPQVSFSKISSQILFLESERNAIRKGMILNFEDTTYSKIDFVIDENINSPGNFDFPDCLIDVETEGFNPNKGSQIYFLGKDSEGEKLEVIFTFGGLVQIDIGSGPGSESIALPENFSEMDCLGFWENYAIIFKEGKFYCYDLNDENLKPCDIKFIKDFKMQKVYPFLIFKDLKFILDDKFDLYTLDTLE